MSELDDDERELIARLRALPVEGEEPSWERFGRDLARVLDAAPPKPWWRRWWAPGIGVSLAAATAAAVLLWPAPATPPEVVAVIEPDAEPAPLPARVPDPPRAGDAILAIGAEGEIVDVDLEDEEVVAGVIEALDEDLAAELAEVPEEPVEGLVPDLDLDWIDDLDDDELEAVALWLEET